MILRFLCMFFCTVIAVGTTWADLSLSQTRFARGDVDGDGQIEIVVGGRLEEGVPVDAPRSMRKAGLGIYRQTGNLLQPISERGDLHVVADVAMGDVDGDGRDEVASVGMGQLIVWDWRDGALVPLASVDLSGQRTDRVAIGDVNGDGRDEIAVTIYDIGPEADIGQTDVVFYRWNGSRCVPMAHHLVDLHVGDLCLVSSLGNAMLVLEVGAGEEGGVIRGMQIDGRALFDVKASPNGLRALSLDTYDNRLVVGRLDGVVQVYDIAHQRIFLRESLAQQPTFSDVLILPNRTVFLGGSLNNTRALPLGF